MKRDLDLIRSLLIHFEEKCSPPGIVDTSQAIIGGYSPYEISYHVGLLVDAGLITTGDSRVFGQIPSYAVKGLTWAGHEFLDASRDPKNWEKAKGIMRDVGSATLETAKFILSEIIKASIQTQFKS